MYLYLKSVTIFGSFAREENTDECDLADELEEFVGLKVNLVSGNAAKERFLKAFVPDLMHA